MVVKKINPIDSMWVEKYRPQTLNEMVFTDKEKIRNYLKNHSSMQHLLLFSKTPGTGKSSLSRVIINELGGDALYLNSSDDRKIEVIREKVVSFVRTKSSVPGMRRIVFMDEADGMTSASMDALRNLMETYSANALFILTCNKIEKIIEPIQSRCVRLEFSKPDKKELFEFLKNICVKEELEYTDEGINQVILLNYPSIRDCVKTLQVIKTEGKKVTEELHDKLSNTYDEIYDIITKEKDWKKVQEQVFSDTNIDIMNLNKHIWFKAVMESNIRLMQITSANEKHFKGSDPIVIFVTSLLDMVK